MGSLGGATFGLPQTDRDRNLSTLTLRMPAGLARQLLQCAAKEWVTVDRVLSQPKTALFCSARCPGDAILRAYDQAAKWRDEGRCVISVFHSPVVKECLRILLRSQQPIIIICPPARCRSECLRNGRRR